MFGIFWVFIALLNYYCAVLNLGVFFAGQGNNWNLAVGIVNVCGGLLLSVWAAEAFEEEWGY